MDDAPDAHINAIHLRWLNARSDIQHIISLSETTSQPFTQRSFRKTFKREDGKPQRRCMIAEVEGKVVGYVIFETHAKHYGILTIGTSPELQEALFSEARLQSNDERIHTLPQKDKSIGEYLVYFLMSKLSPNNKVAMQYNVNERDTVTLETLQKCGFKPSSVAPILSRYFKGDDAIVMQYQLPGTAHLTIPEQQKSSRKRSGQEKASEVDTQDSGRLLVMMRERLAALTLTEWQIVKENGKGGYTPVDISDIPRDTSQLSLQTISKISTPSAAHQALRNFFGVAQQRRHGGAEEEAGHVTVPASWVRPIHLQWGLAANIDISAAFKPAETQARYRQFEDAETWEARGQQRKSSQGPDAQSKGR